MDWSIFSRDKDKSQGSYPALILKKRVVFPKERVSLILEGEEAARAINLAHQKDHLIILLVQKNGDRSSIGVIARADQHGELAPGVIGVLAEGLRRVKVLDETEESGVKMIRFQEIETTEIKGEQLTHLKALTRNMLDQFKKIIQTEESLPLLLFEDLQRENIPPEDVGDIIAAGLRLEFEDKLALLETLDPEKRLKLLNSKLVEEVNIAQTEVKIQQEMAKDVGEAQKEFILRERLKAIEKELGIFEEQKNYENLEQKLKEVGLSSEAEIKVMGELRRLKQLPEISPEVSYLRTWLEWIADLPWQHRVSKEIDLKKARQILDEDHYGLEKAKERVLEYLAVEKLTKGGGRGNILCFVGPPGTGKTSVGQSIARALGRRFVRISLGGVRDEAEIRGHRRTYVGALPGRIIQGMKTAGSKNPIFMMDEIDKIGTDFQGDPAAALLEVLDPAQNNSFSDHYIEIPFDLSEVFFITTANILDPIPPALRDRLEVIEFPGYSEEEKFHIARQFLLPRVLTGSGLGEEQFSITDAAIRKIITYYTRESGVREIERKLSEIARKVARQIAEGQIKGNVEISERNVGKFLGPEEFQLTVKEETDEVGVATGLAWTPAGGEIIFIEASQVPGKGNLTLTGQLGDIMQESAKAALTYVRGKADILSFDPDFYYHTDVHIHVPSGAISKDGPSSGIAMATALASMITKRKVKKDVALTGEVTLSGKVLPVGGIKEKVLAAHRSGVKTVILPADNEKNLVDIPEEIRKELDFRFAKHMDEVLQIALEGPVVLQKNQNMIKSGQRKVL